MLQSSFKNSFKKATIMLSLSVLAISPVYAQESRIIEAPEAQKQAREQANQKTQYQDRKARAQFNQAKEKDCSELNKKTYQEKCELFKDKYGDMSYEQWKAYKLKQINRIQKD